MNATPTLTFRLYWLRESACDSGTLVRAAELEPAIRQRVVDLASQDSDIRQDEEWLLRLPFLDQKEWRKRDEILRATPFERVGRLIRAVLPEAAATRDMAATCVLVDPAWQNLPKPGDAEYFSTWQRVSLALQRSLKNWIAREYFRDAARFEDRGLGYTVAAYQASRLCHGRPRTEFTYDFSDFPDCHATVRSALRLTGRAVQAALAGYEERLREEGRPRLANRYAPVWHEDVVVAAAKKPKPFVELLVAECAVVNAVIDLGGDPSVATVNRVARIINAALRNVLGVDMRRLGTDVLEEATRVLTAIAADRERDAGDGRAAGHRNAIAAGRPHARIGH
jgi:hypothetical protein